MATPQRKTQPRNSKTDRRIAALEVKLAHQDAFNLSVFKALDAFRATIERQALGTTAVRALRGGE